MKRSLLHFHSESGAQKIHVAIADTMLTRMRGLLARPALNFGEGMLLRSCNMVHTVGMQYPIDVLFLSRDGVVLKIVETLKKNRTSGHVFANCVLELAAGEVKRCGITLGQTLPIQML